MNILRPRTPERPKNRNLSPNKRKAILMAAALFLGGLIYKEARSEEKPQDKVEAVVEMKGEKTPENSKMYDYVNKYKDMALDAATENPDTLLPYELLLGVSAHESAYGQSELAQEANNFFGVIAKDGWDGEVYYKLTDEEYVGKRTEEIRPFRKYANDADSFRDFVKKIYFKNPDGTYRYQDVMDYINTGGKDPLRITELLSDVDYKDEPTYATGSEWRDGVKKAIRTVDEISDLIIYEEGSGEPGVPFPGKIDLSRIDFNELTSGRDAKVVEAQRNGFSLVSLEKFDHFQENGITKKGTAGILDIIGSGEGQEEYIRRVYEAGIDKEDLKYIVIHLWANGLEYDKSTGELVSFEGNSHESTLSNQIKAWYGDGIPNWKDNPNWKETPSCGYLLSDNDPADLWQLTDDEFGKTNHAGAGVQDFGHETHSDVNNRNAIGIEVQADTILDVGPLQYEKLIYWTTKMLIDSGKIYEGMSAEEISEIVDKTVIGHGKTAPNQHDAQYQYDGYEFGYKYTRPLIQAISQFAYTAVNK